MKHLMELKNLVRQGEKMRMAVVAAEESNVLLAVDQARKEGIVEPLLIGDAEEIQRIIRENDLDLVDCKVVEADLESSPSVAVKKVLKGEADFLMKGSVDSSQILKAVLNKENGLRTDRCLTSIGLFEVPEYSKLLMLADVGVIPNPDMDMKVDIINNIADLADTLEYESVKIACVGASEKISRHMPASFDSEKLHVKSLHGEFGSKVFVDGPMSVDLAISKKSVEIKKYTSEVAGDADALLFPNLEMGNGVAKTLTCFGRSRVAGVVMGAKVPIVLTSRAHTHETKFYSIVLASILAKSGGRDEVE